MIINYPSGGKEGVPQRLIRILPLLACPLCRGGLTMGQASLKCVLCGAVHPVKNGVPVLLPEGVADAGAMGLSEEDRVSRHPYSESAEKIIQSQSEGWVLDLGAGGKLDRRENVVQIDIFRYPAVDVVASADCLPFQDDTFDAVVSQAVFEHLQYPEWAVKEIRRVLKPGGVAKIDTAFLQPEHGYPYHFYNATETGLLHWFRDFDIQWSGVEPFQHPKWAMHWFLGVYLDFVGVDHASTLRGLTVGELVDVLQRHSVQAGAPHDAQAIEALDALPEHVLRVLAAGVSMRALNPPKHPVQLEEASLQPAESLNREREMAQLRMEKTHLTEKARTLTEQLRASQEKSEYLAQFYPSARNLALFAASWADPMRLRSGAAVLVAGDSGADGQLFATLVVRPKTISALLDTFFSLINQVFGGWQLLLVTQGAASSSVKQAAIALSRLDQRVEVLELGPVEAALQPADIAAVRGEYWIELPEGATLSTQALQEVITVARNLPGVRRIGFDFDRGLPGGDVVRCVTLSQDGSKFVGEESHAFSPFFSLKSLSRPTRSGPKSTRDDAHIPLSLVHLVPFQRTGDEAQKASFAYLLEQYKEVADELNAINVESPMAARELRQLNADIGNYLSQFYFDSNPVGDVTIGKLGLLRWVRRSIGRRIRHWTPLGALNLVVALRATFSKSQAQHGLGGTVQPAISMVLEPQSALALIRTFFSLSHQTYAGWELLVVETMDQSPAVKRAIRDFSRLDARVIPVAAGKSKVVDDQVIKDAIRGDYFVQLVDGVTLAFDAIEQVVTLIQASAGLSRILSDFDSISQPDRLPMRCYNFPGESSEMGRQKSSRFDGTFLRNKRADANEFPADSLDRTAHIPRCLFHIMN